MHFGLMFFAASEESLGAEKYRLVVDSARFGDREGFSSVWVPERHFTAFGGLYPNPAVLHAGLATCTSRIRLNAGSVVAPLHHPLRIAEEWSVVDNLSHGRVGLSFASGWNPDDFVFAPDRYADRHEQMIAAMQTVQRLWRGEPFEGTNGAGQPARVTVFPRPVQPELPVWMTVAGNPRHFERAGELGANLLTHLLDQDEDVLASRIALYRNARAAAGFDPGTGIVSLMIHTFVGSDAATVREQARRPYGNYIKANIGLFKGLAHSRGRDADLSKMSPADLDEFVNFLYDRFAASRGLIGTPESCAPLVARLEAIGVTELACLLDFGPPVDLILENLPHLARLKHMHAPAAIAAAAPARFDRHAVLARCGTAMTGAAFHDVLRSHGIDISGAFEPGASIWRRDGEAIAAIELPAETPGYQVHPAALDACGRMLAAALPGFGAGAASYVPSGFDACDVVAPLAGAVWVHATAAQGSDGAALTGDVTVYRADGDLIARLTGLTLTSMEVPHAREPLDDLLYVRAWETAPIPPIAPDMSGSWTIVGDGPLAAAIARAIEARGGTCGRAIDAPARGIVSVCGPACDVAGDASAGDVDGAVAHALRGALEIAQAGGAAPIWIVTRGAAAVRGPGDVTALAQTALWGFGRALAVERPGALGGLIDLDPEAPDEAATEDLLRALTAGGAEDMIAFRGGVRYVPRLSRRAAGAGASTIDFSSGGTVLITGGTGGIGLELARAAASRGARHILICGRRPPGPEAQAALDRLRASGADVSPLQADVADYDALAGALRAAAAAHPPITSVFHLAGVLDDGRIGEQTWAQVRGVLAPKVLGAWNLHRLTGGGALRHFVMFSSIASMLPAPGQAAYAAANAVLDGLAQYRRARGLPALAVNWGPWAGVGHAATDYGRQAHARLASLGIGAIAPDAGWRALDTLIADDAVQAAAASVDWPALFASDPAAARLPFLSAMAPGGVPPQAPAASALVRALEGMPHDERRPHLLAFLSDMVIAALKLRTDAPIDARQPLFDVGLDSIMALELKDRLERALGVPLSATLLFVRPTLDALAEYILTDIVRAGAPQAGAGASGAASEDELTRLLLREIDASRAT